MGWEETVMRDEEMRRCRETYTLTRAQVIAKAQAEKSYKAGYIEATQGVSRSFVVGYNVGYNAGQGDVWSRLDVPDYNNGYKLGSRDIIEWIEEHGACGLGGFLVTNIDYIKWQTLLKELEG